MNYPKKVTIGDITVRDGFQHEEVFIPTEAKIWLAEQQILCGFKHLEVTNLGNPKGMPQFKDADDVLKGIRSSKKVKDLLDDVSITAVTIRERAAERAIEAYKRIWARQNFVHGVNQRIPSQKELWHLARGVLEDGRGVHQESARYRYQSKWNGEYDLGMPNRRTNRHEAGCGVYPAVVGYRRG